MRSIETRKLGARPALVKLLLLACLAGAVIAALPSAAAASAAKAVPGGPLFYVDPPFSGETNTATITLAAGVYTISDTTAIITALDGCTSVTANQVTCPDTGITKVKVMTRAGNDLIDASGVPVEVGIRTGPGDDTIIGSPTARNLLDAGAGVGTQTVTGGAADDKLKVRSGPTTINGGAGDDLLRGGTGNDTLNAGDGNDLAKSGAGSDTVSGGAGWDIIGGASGNDNLDGGSDGDAIVGSSGDDTINAVDGAGDDLVACGGGNDTATIDWITALVDPADHIASIPACETLL